MSTFVSVRAPHILGAALAAAVLTASHAAIIYVNAAQALPLAQQNGSSWALAYRSIPDAVDAAAAGDEIWVAQGTYLPTDGTNRNATFVAAGGVTLLGGFAVGADSLDERDPDAFETIMSGDIGVAGDATDNSYHVLSAGNSLGAIVDGFTITDGFGNGPTFADRTGANVHFVNSDVLVRRCRIRNANAVSGGAVFVLNPGANGKAARFVNCVIADNTGGSTGGVDVQGAGVAFVQCAFLGNHAASEVGALRFFGATGVQIQNCVFSGNSSGQSTGGIFLATSSAEVHFSSFSGNTGPTSGSIRNQSNSVTLLSNCVFHGNGPSTLPEFFNQATLTTQHCGFKSSPASGPGNFVTVDPFVDADGADNVAGTDDDDLRLRPTSNGIDRGTSSSFPLDVGDIDGDGNTTEPLPLDADLLARAVDDILPNQGAGATPYLDVGAYELARTSAVLFVDKDAGGEKTGADWHNAMTDLQTALDTAVAFAGVLPVEIWVAKGVYKPTEENERARSFTIPAGLAIYGGFSAVETSRADRRPLEFPTVLSGEIGGPSIADNSFYVVDFASDLIGPSTILDGFVVTRGNANGGPSPVLGGGIRVWNGASPTIRCSSIVGNAAIVGGGIGISGSSTAPVIHNCLISGNVAQGTGGGIGLAGNSAGTQIVSCTIVGNAADEGGGVGLAQSGGSVAIRNSIVYFNEDSDGGGEKSQLELASLSQLSLIASCMPCAGSTFGGIAMVGADPLLANVAGNDEIIGTADDSAALKPFSPCIDAGMPDAGAAYPGDLGDSNDDGVVGAAEPFPHDLAVHKRLVDDRAMIDRLETVLDIGALESQESSRGTPPKPSDLNGDGETNGADLAIVLGAFGTDSPNGDINGDCVVDGADIGIVLGDWT
jgi:hypothetical protein